MPASILGNLPTEDFLRDYWQKKPLLVRGALSNFQPPISADELAGLALEDEVESRIVMEHGTTSPWELTCGPFTTQQFAELPKSHWTLLVQAVDLWVPEVASLLKYFHFLPPWRLDDIMVSYAPMGGSVGPHFDYYDVFLLQAEGQRRWQIGQTCDQDSTLLGDVSLRILSEFQKKEEWVLNPGDMLYLPPQVAHYGIAENNCQTYSVGFRAPTMTEILGDLATELMTQGHSGYYRDPPLTPEMARQQIDPRFIEQIQSMLRDLADNKALLADWFARYMTTPKYPELVDELEEERCAAINDTQYRNGEPSE